MSETLRYFAEQARTLQLDLSQLQNAHPETLRTFAAQVLQELTALGLLEDTHGIGCYTEYSGRGGDA
ncbi:hypothetical protein [Deinococcus roseus]|uniref:Uncharacterized protein n=1 Tax=Deinococcus roseus TaxID=392414 RepID=A0ABQ2D0J6_9DEIO|nr:hypothetical protein [Deinococcus roseus]GGJ34451.1 hypothetical protein GCM10008938_20820 [Deinococcus roseus]